MDAPYQLEQALIELGNLSQVKRGKILKNTAGIWERAIGYEACKTLADLIRELIEESKPKSKKKR